MSTNRLTKKQREFIEGLEKGSIERLTDAEKKKLRRMVPSSALIATGAIGGGFIAYLIAYALYKHQKERQIATLAQQSRRLIQAQPPTSLSDSINSSVVTLDAVRRRAAEVQQNLNQLQATYQQVRRGLPSQIATSFSSSTEEANEGIREIGGTVNHLWEQLGALNKGVYAMPIGIVPFFTLALPLVLSLIPKINLSPCNIAKTLTKGAKTIRDFNVLYFLPIAALQTFVSLYSLEWVLNIKRMPGIKFSVTNNILAWGWSFMGALLYQVLIVACLPYGLKLNRSNV